MRLTIDEYARRFKMSKEMIRAKLHANRLNYTVENGITYILVESAPTTYSERQLAAGMLLKFYQEENVRLSEKIKSLEEKIDTLINDKEQMLKDERERVEKIYLGRDEQLKAFLELIATKKQNQPVSAQLSDTVHEVMVSNEISIPANPTENRDPSQPINIPPIVSLNEYIDIKQLSNDEAKSIKKRFAHAYGNDIRIIQKNGEFILDFSKFDYNDLLSN